MRFWITIAFLTAALSGAAAEDYPREIQARFEVARTDCKDAAGHGPDSKGVVIRPEAVRKLDLTGDRRDDYIIDFGQISCDDNQAYFCGSGGCTLSIVVAKPNGSFVTVYDDQVLNYALSAGGGARTITLNLHHGDCHDGREVCVKSARITDRPLNPKMVRR